MINKDRIVPVIKTDLLTLYGTMFTLAQISYDVLPAVDVEGHFEIEATGDAGSLFANQPVISIELSSGVTAVSLAFVADPEFTGITQNGAAVTLASGSLGYDDLVKDGATLYTAALASGEVTISAISPVI